jgi:hypothetical protein
MYKGAKPREQVSQADKARVMLQCHGCKAQGCDEDELYSRDACPFPSSSRDDVWRCYLCSSTWCISCRPEGASWCKNCELWHCIECAVDHPAGGSWNADIHFESDCPPEDDSFLNFPDWKNALTFVKPYCQAMRFASVVRLTKLFDTKDVDMPLQLLQRIVLDAVPHTDRIHVTGARKSLMKTAEAARMRYGSQSL